MPLAAAVYLTRSLEVLEHPADELEELPVVPDAPA